MVKLTLDVGCGGSPKGSVNCDWSLSDSEGHRGLIEADHKIDPKLISNFVLADACFLPFKEAVFTEVISSQVIEHVPNPFLMLKELTRVSKCFVRVETVNRFGERFETFLKPKRRQWVVDHHINRFNRRWWNDAANRLNCRIIRSYELGYFCFPNTYFVLFRWPTSIGVVFEKNKSKRI
jgi:hypothetical protein